MELAVICSVVRYVARLLVRCKPELSLLGLLCGKVFELDGERVDTVRGMLSTGISAGILLMAV